MNTNIPKLLDLFEVIFGVRRCLPGLKHLEEVVSGFSAIPYENLTKIIRAYDESDPLKRMRQPDEVLLDYSRWGAGGTCFSLTWCMKAILSGYGYICHPRMADLGRQQCNHCAMIVEHESRVYLLDPGYLITRPLPIPDSGSVVHETRLHPVLLERDRLSGGLNLSTLEPDGSKYRYYLHPENCDNEKFRQYWMQSFSWNMMHSMLISRSIPEGRFYLHDRHARWFNRQGHRSEKLRDHFDDHVSFQTGIHRDIVMQARKILAEMMKGQDK